MVALVLAALIGAAAAYIVTHSQLDSRRSDTVDDTSAAIQAAVARRAYYLEDVADMVGVHDDADISEFSRYSHVRGRDAGDVVSVQWVRRSPTGQLAPPGDVPAGVEVKQPVLVAPTDSGNSRLADAAAASSAAAPLRSAEAGKRVATSAPVKLADGQAGFYLAVPVEAHRFSGDVSKLESRSAVVGLIDAQALVDGALAGSSRTALRLRDGAAPLAAVGSDVPDPASTAVPVPGRTWSLSVAAGSLTTIEQILPWLILVLGLALAFFVALVLRNVSHGREVALVAQEEAEGELELSLRKVEQANRELEKANADAERRSREDALTGIFNRRHFGEVLAAELAKPPGDEPPAVLLLDLDRFKRINDRHGHLEGDTVLQIAAERIGSALREGDVLARWGGEEFAILAKGLDREGVAALGERARHALADHPVEIEGIEIGLTLSVGAATAVEGLRSPDSLFEAADRALYEAKRAGRNCVRVWDPAAAAATAVTA